MMASFELILSESEWQNLLSFRGYVKQLFEVDIRRKDEFYHDCNSNSASPNCVQEPLSASPEVITQSRTDLNSNSSRFFPSNLLISKNGIEDGQCILHPSPVIVQLQTESSSPSNLEKCQKFAIAFSPSNPDFKSITINLDNQHHFNMVKAYLPSIQQSTSTLINCPPNSTDITIQGHHSCVELAQHQVDLILQSCKTKSLEIQCENQHNLNSNHSSVGTATASTIDNKNDPNAHHSVHSQHLSSLKTNNVTTSPAKSDDSVFFSSNEDYGNQCEDLYNFSALSSLVQEEDNENLVYSPVVNDITLPFKAFTDSYQQKDFNDLEEDKILSDDRFSNRIDQATKLGFSEEQVLKVLRRLGVNSSMDDMMRELVSYPQGVNSEEGMMSLEDFDSNETNLLSRGEDSDDSDGFDVNDSSNLRHIIIDGSNVAMSHGQKVFSCLGIKIVVDWFKNRGHKNITAFVPQWRKEASRPDAPITNQEILTELEEEKIVVFTPSRRVGGTRIVCYDDRFVLQLAVKMDGIVVSNDIYRDLVRERDDFKEVVEKRLLMYSFVQDMFMPPEDPLGRQGPSLDNFLRIRPSDPKNKPEICPYGKKCTFGNKCRFYHPERRYASQKMVAERLRENAELKQKSIKAGKSVESTTDKARQPKQKLSRTLSLFPQDAVDTIPSDGSKRPPLHHSKSLIYPSSYLSDLRLKMEEAESAEAVQEPSTLTMAVNYKDSSSDQMQTIETDSKDGSKSIRQYSSSCNPSPRTSPSPKSDSVKMEVKATRSYPSSPAPNVPPSFTVSNAKSSINIPNPEPQDRYLSGHVLVAKRLSDEDNSSGQFFLQHTSRAPGLLQQENQNLTLSGSLHSSDSNSSPVLPTAKVSNWNPGKESQEPSLWNVTDVYLPPKITNPVYHNELVRRGSNPSSILQQEMKGNSSSGHSPNISRSDQCDSCPTFSKKDEDHGLQHQNFRRSYSTSTPAYSGELMNLGRKFSLNTNNIKPMENVHAKVKPHSSVPLSERAPYNQYHTYTPTIKPQVQRSKMSFDSGISSGGLCVDQPISSNAPFSPTEFYSVPFSDVSNVSSPGVFSPTNQNPMQFVSQQQQPEVMYNPNPAGYAASSSPWQYSPLPNRMLPFQDQGIQSQNFAMPLSNVTPNNQNPPMFNRSPATFTTMANYTSPPPYQPQSYVQPTYQSAMPNVDNQFHPMNMYGGGGNSMPYSPNTPSSPFPLHPPPIQPHAKVIDEEAEIRVDDPRYSIYYHLSSLFGERVVKTFMNRNPDVKNFKELYTLISSYKQDTMM